MKRWKIAIFNNWRIKLGALFAAALIWLLIKHHIDPSPAAAPPPAAALPG